MRPVVIPRSGHPISRNDIDPSCLKVLYRLYRAGHPAYLVGGGVRDLLLGIQPKDFDVATDAHPQRIRKLFRNCVLIGRRFRLAHVRFGNTVIEVSTFRRAPEAEEVGSSDLLIRRDNTFGTPEDDALRRDFTINALFYDIGTFSLIDYVGGLRDLEDGAVRSVGDPHVRYQEDPVRMLRAVKFAARLEFEIVPDDMAAIDEHRDRVRLASIPRLLEEVFKLLAGGASAASFKLLSETRLLDPLLPDVAEHLRRTDAAADPENAPFYRYLFALDEAITDRGRGAGGNALLLAALLLAPLEKELARQGAGGCWESSPVELEAAMDAALRPILRALTVSRRDSERLREALLLQSRLVAAVSGGVARRVGVLAARPGFHDAVALLDLGARAHSELRSAADHWAERAADVEPPPERRRAPRPIARRRGRRWRDAGV